MFERRSLKWPITLAVIMLICLISLTVGWVLLNVLSAKDKPSSVLYWVLLSIGTAMFAAVVFGVIAYLLITIQQVNLNRRQSNFIDSVTHELKSPIASLKLYLQTLGRRTVDEDQRRSFYQSMLMDVDRLDQLINHLLDVARIEQTTSKTAECDSNWLRVDKLLQDLAERTALRYGLPSTAFQLKLDPIEIYARELDLDILFRNLMDNAAKYSGEPSEVSIQMTMASKEGWLHAVVSDNGPGIPRRLRRKIFGRFVRLGSELERTKQGTGLGLFLVRSVLRTLRGKISVDDLANGTGTRFDVWLPHARRAEVSETKAGSRSTGSEAIEQLLESPSDNPSLNFTVTP